MDTPPHPDKAETAKASVAPVLPDTANAGGADDPAAQTPAARRRGTGLALALAGVWLAGLLWLLAAPGDKPATGWWLAAAPPAVLAAWWLLSLRRTHAAVAEAMAALANGEGLRLAETGTGIGAGRMAGRWNALVDALERRDHERRVWTHELETLIGSIGSAVFAISPDGREVLFASRQTNEIYGWPPEAFRQSPELWRNCAHPDDQHALASLTRQLQNSGHYDVEYRIRHRDGGVRWVRHCGSLLSDADGQPLRITALVSDISWRKERELRLQASESRLSGLIRASMDGIVSVDEAGCVVLYNPAAERMFMRPPNAVVGMPVAGLFSSPGSLLALTAPTARPGAAPAPQVVHGLRGDGSEFTMEASIARHAVGERGFITFMLRDITARLAAESRLQQLSRAVEQSPVSIQIVDTALRICYVNKHFSEVTGYADDELIGSSIELLGSSENAGNEYRKLRDTLAGGGEWCGEVRSRRKDGSLLWEYARVTPITGSDGTVSHFLAIKEDITERKAKDERERRREEQLAHSARLILLGEMASSVAHEINQPLTAIAGFSSACARQLGDRPQALELVKKIEAQVVRAGEIVWRTRNFARRQSCREPLDIPALVFGITDWVAGEAARQDIALDTGAVAAELPAVRGDRVQIEQVLLNLVQNALEAVRDVAGERRVAVAAKVAADGGVVVSVADTGCGVPAQVALDVFEPFFTTKSTGLGLGLAISSSIIEDHGGRLWHVPVPGSGAAFHFTLPAAEPATAPH